MRKVSQKPLRSAMWCYLTWFMLKYISYFFYRIMNLIGSQDPKKALKIYVYKARKITIFNSISFKL